MGQVESFTYDVVGNMLTRTDFNGDVVTYTYDVNNRVTLIDYASDSTTDSFTYDNNGNRLTAVNSEGTWSYTYDSMNRLETETQPNGEVLSYVYDLMGNKTQLKVTYADASTRTEISTYDVLNRLATVTDADGNITSYEYDAVGNRVSVTHSNANVTAYVYDELNRLTQLQDKHADESVFQQFDYQLHATGRREKITELSGRISDYTYDSLYRLTDEVITDPINGNYSASYTFDKVGNRIASTINGVSTVYTYDDNDRLTQEGGETYTYDDNGNTLAKTIDADSTTYTYDARQKLIAANILESGVTKLSSYRYNVDGIRTQKVEEGIATNYLVDSNRDYAQVIAEMDTSNAVAVEFIFGDDLLAQNRSGTLSNYQYDGLGSTRALTDSTGNVSDEYFYDAFGVELGSSGSTENSYRYTGEQYDSSLDQYYLRARYMDTASGRFTQMDEYYGKSCTPITLNKYAYGNADPVRFTDPSGYFGIGDLMSALNGRAVLSTTAQGVRTAGFSYTKMKGKKTLTKAVTCQIGVSYVKREYSNDMVHGHHPINKSFGGAADQALIFLPANTHRMFHFVLDVVLKSEPAFVGKGNWTSARNWDTISQSRAGRRALYKSVFTASKLVDKFCGLRGRRSLSLFVRINRDRFVGGR